MNRARNFMQDIPNTIEADLIKVRTIKKKYVEQLIEPLSTTECYDDTEFLAYIPGFDSVLARDNITGHLRVIRAVSYYSFHGESREAREKAQVFVHSLPQLLLD